MACMTSTNSLNDYIHSRHNFMLVKTAVIVPHLHSDQPINDASVN
jgi:hypothetical protein